jgi:hypothetical protein
MSSSALITTDAHRAYDVQDEQTVALMFSDLERDVREFGFAVRCVKAHLAQVRLIRLVGALPGET